MHILQHVSFEGAGNIENWGHKNNFSISKTEFFQPNCTLPTLADFDMLVIMGGTMRVIDESAFPWLKQEKALIEAAMSANKKVVGICLGAQLIASVAGARVYTQDQKEIGWYNVKKTKEGKRQTLLRDIPDNFSAFHWHSDTFELPAAASRLFYSEACKEQGFLLGANILALQFHLEVTPKDILGFLEHDEEDLNGGGDFVQTADLIKASFSKTRLLGQVLFTLLDDFMRLNNVDSRESSKQYRPTGANDESVPTNDSYPAGWKPALPGTLALSAVSSHPELDGLVRAHCMRPQDPKSTLTMQPCE
jgi:GMP synthase (glutamine-hydrolysing)